MDNDFAERVLNYGPDSVAEIEVILRMLAEIQGYAYCGACCPHEV